MRGIFTCNILPRLLCFSPSFICFNTLFDLLFSLINFRVFLSFSSTLLWIVTIVLSASTELAVGFLFLWHSVFIYILTWPAQAFHSMVDSLCFPFAPCSNQYGNLQISLYPKSLPRKEAPHRMALPIQRKIPPIHLLLA